MLNFAALEQMVSHALKSVSSADRDGEVKPFTNEGGQSGRGWRTTGAYAFGGDNSRLVYEGLHYETPGICVIRVYREETSEVLFARKWSGDESKFAVAICEAAIVFRASLPDTPVIKADNELELDDMPMAAKERELLESVLKPISPPCNLDAMQEA